MEERLPAKRAVGLALDHCMAKTPISNTSHVHKSTSIIPVIGNFVQTIWAYCHLHENFVMSPVHEACRAQAEHGEQVAGHHDPHQWRDGGKTGRGGGAAIVQCVAQSGVGGVTGPGGRRSTDGGG